VIFSEMGESQHKRWGSNDLGEGGATSNMADSDTCGDGRTGSAAERILAEIEQRSAAERILAEIGQHS
jgi:hypothetical protein